MAPCLSRLTLLAALKGLSVAVRLSDESYGYQAPEELAVGDDDGAAEEAMYAGDGADELQQDGYQNEDPAGDGVDEEAMAAGDDENSPDGYSDDPQGVSAYDADGGEEEAEGDAEAPASGEEEEGEMIPEEAGDDGELAGDEADAAESDEEAPEDDMGAEGEEGEEVAEAGLLAIEERPRGSLVQHRQYPHQYRQTRASSPLSARRQPGQQRVNAQQSQRTLSRRARPMQAGSSLLAAKRKKLVTHVRSKSSLLGERSIVRPLSRQGQRLSRSQQHGRRQPVMNVAHRRPAQQPDLQHRQAMLKQTKWSAIGHPRRDGLVDVGKQRRQATAISSQMHGKKIITIPGGHIPGTDDDMDMPGMSRAIPGTDDDMGMPDMAGDMSGGLDGGMSGMPGQQRAVDSQLRQQASGGGGQMGGMQPGDVPTMMGGGAKPELMGQPEKMPLNKPCAGKQQKAGRQPQHDIPLPQTGTDQDNEVVDSISTPVDGMNMPDMMGDNAMRSRQRQARCGGFPPEGPPRAGRLDILEAKLKQISQMTGVMLEGEAKEGSDGKGKDGKGKSGKDGKGKGSSILEDESLSATSRAEPTVPSPAAAKTDSQVVSSATGKADGQAPGAATSLAESQGGNIASNHEEKQALSASTDAAQSQMASGAADKSAALASSAPAQTAEQQAVKQDVLQNSKGEKAQAVKKAEDQTGQDQKQEAQKATEKPAEEKKP
eukprot:TRINITY_DN2495_c0_g1_i1.p1 TRINITY_DN2495_c0_g1~~TRINITY_DN2495_c0_g1_i1.p1  ORF type:complete len:713 (+),score=206.06 TRINITY_DN2495_c0_g1_i1:85-2223(+)